MHKIVFALQVVVLIVLFAAMGGWLCPYKALYIAAAVQVVSIVLPNELLHV